MRRSTSGLEARERKLPNWVLRSHGTGDGREGLVAHSGAKLAVGDMTSDVTNRDSGTSEARDRGKVT